MSALKGTAGQPSGSRAAARVRRSLATAQIALSTALLILAGLFTKSLFNVSRTNLGFRTDNLITFSVSPRRSGYNLEQSRALYERIEDGLIAFPGVAGVTSSNVGLFGDDSTAQLWETGMRVEGYPFGLAVDTNARFLIVGADYFRTLGIPLISGRDFTQFDAEGTARVAIVNEKFVEKFNLGAAAIGKHIGPYAAYGAPADTTIIGVARNAKYGELRGEIQPEFFVPYRQRTEVTGNNFYVRTAGSSARILAAIPRLMAGIDSNVPVEALRSMPAQFAAYITISRVTSILSTAFAALATLLGGIGLYGVLAYTLAQRTREIGIRMALGAAPSRVRRMVFGQVAWMTVIGAVIGVAVALALGRFSESLLYQLNARDPLVLSVSGILIVLVAFAAGLIPSHRASHLDPLNALHYE
jgi:predicted permease